MDIDVSDFTAICAFVVSVLSLLVSFFSVYYTKGQRDIALIAQISTSHERYRELARSLKTQHREALEKLGSTAYDAYFHLVAALDGFDADTQESSSASYVRPLRHLISEAADMLFYAFKGQLGLQSGVNIAMRFSWMATLEDKLKPIDTGEAASDFRRRLEAQYRQDPDGYQETALLSNVHFCQLVSELQHRIVPARRVDLLLLLLEVLAPVRAQLKNVVLDVAPSVAEIEDALDDNVMDHFRLESSVQLHKRLQSMRTQFETLENLRLFHASAETLHHYRNYVSITIQASTMLLVLANLGNWGWDN